jgi:tRNA/rRNA methyltransferase
MYFTIVQLGKSFNICYDYNMDHQANLDRIQIVLVETQDGANIGSVCRAMKTMGITRLAIVGDRIYDENRVRTLALHAADVWENHRRFPTLREALADSVLSVGATRRRGKFRKFCAVSPEQLAQRVSTTGEGIVSIVFGREADGLTDDEVATCSMVVTIPTSPLFPSLNLSQAVQIITYTLYNQIKPWPVEASPVTQQRTEVAAQRVIDTLETLPDYFKGDEKKWTYRFLRDAFARASLTESEVQKMEKIFVKMTRIRNFKASADEIAAAVTDVQEASANDVRNSKAASTSGKS